MLGCLLYQIGDINGKNGKHHHTQRGQKDRKHFAGSRNGIDIRPHCGYVHKSPPQGIGVIDNQRIYGMFPHKKQKARKIDRRQQQGYIRMMWSV